LLADPPSNETTDVLYIKKIGDLIIKYIIIEYMENVINK